MTDSDPQFDVRDPRFERGDSRAEVEYAPPVPPARRSPWTTCLIGCLVMLILGLVLVAFAVYWVSQNWRDLTAVGGAEMMNAMIDATDLPDEERREMKVEVRRLADAFREGRLTGEQFMRIMDEVVNSPLLTLFAVSAIERHFFDRSGLSEEQKLEGRQTLRRFVRGAVDRDIDESAVEAVLAHIADRQPDGSWRLRDRVTDDELRAALAEAKRWADEAGVPQEPEVVDAAAEFRRIVDDAIGER